MVLYYTYLGGCMSIKDTYRYLIGAYYGIEEIDEYITKQYVLKELKNYIKEFLEENPPDFDIVEEENDVIKNVSLYTKLHDALIVLPKINGPIDLTLLIKDRIKELKRKM